MRHFRRVIASIITALIYIVPMMIFDWRITTIILALNFISLSINMRVSKKMKAFTTEIHEEMGHMTVSFSNIVSGMSMIRIFQLGDEMIKNFNKNNHKTSELTLKRAKTVAFLSSYNFFISMVSFMVFLLIGTIMVRNDLTTYGNIIVIMSLQTALGHNLREFGEYFPHFYNAMAATNRVYDFLELQEEPERYPMTAIENSEYIQFDKVTFAYGD
ncbi:ABC transporter transmembrane domain-containing protein [Natranaerovirga hydrolytica]|uniref:ABC transporter transmembrane domain-containing protein n=1 Tax=Natranaerovirga hydrolytica TaxID=680378 RepID=UPI001403FC75|nr:ABC transporter ATP-binding protein [Natranaerovirga hydrolytica]